jgi:hypothetical protein
LKLATISSWRFPLGASASIKACGDLAHAHNKRDTFAASMTKLAAEIAELEARLSAETERRKREHAASEIVGIKKRVRDRSDFSGNQV